LSKKKSKMFLIYLGFFFILVGIISILFVGSFSKVFILILCLLNGVVYLIIGFEGNKHRVLIIEVVITFVLFFLLGLFSYLVIEGNPFTKNHSKEVVLKYLTQEKKYKSDDILQINGYYQMFVNTSKNTCHYGAKVIFKKNPKAVKYYVVCPSTKVILQDQKNASQVFN
jgi:hypothetical protein